MDNPERLSTCPYCGHKLDRDSVNNFCPYCAKKLVKVCKCWIVGREYDCGRDPCPGLKRAHMVKKESMR